MAADLMVYDVGIDEKHVYNIFLNALPLPEYEIEVRMLEQKTELTRSDIENAVRPVYERAKTRRVRGLMFRVVLLLAAFALPPVRSRRQTSRQRNGQEVASLRAPPPAITAVTVATPAVAVVVVKAAASAPVVIPVPMPVLTRVTPMAAARAAVAMKMPLVLTLVRVKSVGCLLFLLAKPVGWGVRYEEIGE